MSIRATLALTAFLVAPTYGVLLKDWGTESYINRLAYSTYSLFSDAFRQVTASLSGSYPVGDVKQIFFQDIQNENNTVEFVAYNGWMENIRLETANLGTKGALRRMIMTRMHSKNHLDGNAKHEIYVCTSCMSIVADGFHYGYIAVYKGKEASGTLDNMARMEYDVSYTMNVMLRTEERKPVCTATLDQINLSLMGCDSEEKSNVMFDARLSNAHGFSFLADHVDSWMFAHFNTTVRGQLQQRIDSAIKKSLSQMNPCKEFLVS